MRRQKLFRWCGINQSGQLLESDGWAANKTILYQQLRNQSITPLRATQTTRLMQQKLRHKKITALLQQLVDLLNGGVAISQATQIILNNNRKNIAYIWLEDFYKKIQQGQALSQIWQVGPLFSALELALLQAGEQSGNLTQALQQIILHRQMQAHLKSQLVKALRYPLFILAMAILITIGLLIFVIPQFQEIFAGFDAPLPWFTQQVIVVAEFLKHKFILLMTFFPSLVLLVRWLFKKNIRCQQFWQKEVLKLPLLGKLIQCQARSLWAQTLAITLNAGISMLDALAMANRTLPLYWQQHHGDLLVNKIRGGESLYRALVQQPLTNTNTHPLIDIAENAGTLAETLQRIASVEQTQFQEKLALYFQFLEPFVMLILAFIAGCLIIALYLPIFNLSNIIK